MTSDSSHQRASERLRSIFGGSSSAAPYNSSENDRPPVSPLVIYRSPLAFAYLHDLPKFLRQLQISHVVYRKRMSCLSWLNVLTRYTWNRGDPTLVFCLAPNRVRFLLISPDPYAEPDVSVGAIGIRKPEKQSIAAVRGKTTDTSYVFSNEQTCCESVHLFYYFCLPRLRKESVESHTLLLSKSTAKEAPMG